MRLTPSDAGALAGGIAMTVFALVLIAVNVTTNPIVLLIAFGALLLGTTAGVLVTRAFTAKLAGRN